MKRFAVVAAVVSYACGAAEPAALESLEPAAAAAPVVSAEPAEAPVPSIWLADDHPLRAAQDAWGLPLPCDVAVQIVPGDDATVACNRTPVKGQRVGGCARWSRCEVLLTETATDYVKVHELGHIYRQSSGHPLEGCPAAGPGPHIMCAQGSVRAFAPEPDAVDYAFVLREVAP